jgi:hypothetical protein
MRDPVAAYQDDTHASLQYRIGTTTICAYIAPHRFTFAARHSVMGWRGGFEVVTWINDLVSYSTREEYTGPFEDRDAIAQGVTDQLCKALGENKIPDQDMGPAGNASSIGFELGEVDHHGELELRMSLDEKYGSAWISKEMWERMGEVAGWQGQENSQP